MPELAEGKKLAGCYVLRRRVDAIADEVIWIAYDEVLGKEVSLHFVPPAVRSDARAMDALRQEIKRNRQLIHPNILRVYDFIEESDWAAMSMDCLEGESLAALLKKKEGGAFEPAEIKPWIAQICQTIADAHKIQLVHRDVTPANIFVEKGGKLLVANFGIGRCIHDALNRLRPPGEPDPAIAFLSPQQLDGERPSALDDVYGIGALVYALLTGEPPFVGADLVPRIRRTAPVPVNQRREELKRGGSKVPEAWEKVIAQCLEKNPDDRPKGMVEVASRLALDKAGAETAAPRESKPAEAAPAASATSMAGKSELRPVDMLLAKAKAASAAEAAKSSEPLPSKPAESVPGAKSEPKIPKTEKAIPDHYPSFEPRRGNFPVTWLAAAILLLAIGIYGAFFLNPQQPDSQPIETPIVSDEPSVAPEATFAANVEQPAPPSATDEPPAAVAPEPAAPAKEPMPEPPPLAKEPMPEPPAPAVAVVPPAPVVNEIPPPPAPAATRPVSEPTRIEVAQAAPAPAAPEPAMAAAPTDPALAAKIAALDSAKKAADAAQKAQQDMQKQQQQAQAAAAEAKKALDDKTKAAAPIMKAAEDLAATRKKREEEAQAADMAAQEAQRAAAEKARAADEAKKALAAVETEGKTKLAAMQKADSELKDLQKALEEKQRLAADASKAAADAAAKIEAQEAAIKRAEQEVADARMAAQKAAEEARRQAEAKRKMIESQMEEARRIFAEKMKALEDALKSPEAMPAPAVPTPTTAPPVPAPAPEPPATKPSAAAPATPVPAKAADVTLAMKTEPPKPAATPVPEVKKPAASTGFENSLGMKFAPVGDILFCIWQTRVKDFELFAKTTGLKSTLWKDPGFKQGPDHPVVNVTWQEAIAFCKWLTIKEQKEGVLSASQAYRLPYDLEWSKAVGLPEESGRTPEARDMGVPDVYPWGNAWPPPPGAGNYTGEETGSDVAIKGYDDGYAWTSPVGTFAPNKYGLYDMGGNVWQWCMDAWNNEQKAKVLRGASWYNGALKLSLLSSCRVHAAPDSSTDNYGFRCVIASGDAGKPARR